MPRTALTLMEVIPVHAVLVIGCQMTTKDVKVRKLVYIGTRMALNVVPCLPHLQISMNAWKKYTTVSRSATM